MKLVYRFVKLFVNTVLIARAAVKKGRIDVGITCILFRVSMVRGWIRVRYLPQ